jgi:hypothetical protein
MHKYQSALVFLVIIAIALIAGICIEVYKFKDCKKVGHTSLYCFLDAGK